MRNRSTATARKRKSSAVASQRKPPPLPHLPHSHHYDNTGAVSYHDRDMDTYEVDARRLRSRSNSSSRRGSMRGAKQPFGDIPATSQQRPLPAPRRHLHKSTGDLYNEPHCAAPSKPTVNPRSNQKGLIQIISSADSSPSKIPRRTSVTKSMERIPSLQRRMSLSKPTGRRNRSESPERQRSVDSTTMIDLGVTASSMVRAANRISRPSALSPIVGTPNKDREGESAHGTKIPVRRNSSINLNMKSGSRGNSRAGSRETSPVKPGTSKSPTKIPKKVGAGGTKKAPSTVKAGTSTKGANNDASSASDTTKGVQKESASARKEPSTLLRDKSSVKKVASTAVKRESSTLKRQSSNVKRETSTLKPSTLRRQASTVGKKEPSTLLKNQSDSSLTKRLEKKNSFKNKRRTSSESDGMADRVKSGRTVEHASDMLIALTTPSATLPVTAAIAAQPVQITTAVTNQLNKSNSSSQIPLGGSASDHDAGKVHTPVATAAVAAAAAATAAAAAIDESRRELTTPAEIIENATKTLETIQRTVTDATDEIHKTIEENLTDLKSLEKDMQMQSSSTPGEAGHAGASLQKKASTKTLGGKSDIVKTDASGSDRTMTAADADASNAEHSAPIETMVNVIDGSAGNDTTTLHDGDEKMSERAISMEPDVELNGANMQRMQDGMQQHQPNTNGGPPMHMDTGNGVKDNR